MRVSHLLKVLADRNPDSEIDIVVCVGEMHTDMARSEISFCDAISAEPDAIEENFYATSEDADSRIVLRGYYSPNIEESLVGTENGGDA